ncbi:hypothetical protein XI09_40530 [Bradyrhizobium sp. CCBAU 11386]|nr:hypothetical protein [Bradyrhizobium sp. CCBAU 11386]
MPKSDLRTIESAFGEAAVDSSRWTRAEHLEGDVEDTAQERLCETGVHRQAELVAVLSTLLNGIV